VGEVGCVEKSSEDVSSAGLSVQSDKNLTGWFSFRGKQTTKKNWLLNQKPDD